MVLTAWFATRAARRSRRTFPVNVLLAQAVLFRGADISVVWPQLVALLAIGGTLFAITLFSFRKTINDPG